MTHLGKYFQVFLNSLQNFFEYRWNIFLRFLFFMISFVSVYYLWTDVFASKTLIGNYDKSQMISYVVIVSYFFSCFWVPSTVASDIQTGELSMYLVRPINYIFYQYCVSMAKRLLIFFLGLPVYLLFFYIFRDSLYIVNDPLQYLLLFISLFLALNLIFFIDIVISFLEFWFDNSELTLVFFRTIIYFFGGLTIPLFLLPMPIQIVSDLLPFKYLGYYIVDSFIAGIPTFQILIGFSFQIFWIFVFFLITIFVWKRGVNKYEAYGS